MEDKKNKKDMDRRYFLKVLGSGAVASTAVLYGCGGNASQGISPDGTATGEIPTDKMTYRTNPTTGDKVSLLGYGCMRLPTISNSSARDSSDEIDQEMVNRLTDYALAHGINYFDTSPAYCKGRSERSMGIALSRHPRDSYFIATKLSNVIWITECSTSC